MVSLAYTAPPAGTGTLRFRVLIKRGGPNTGSDDGGEFYYPVYPEAQSGGQDLVVPAPKSPATQGMGIAPRGPLVAAREAAPGVSVNSSVNVHHSNISNNISSSNTVTNTVTNAGNTSASVATSTVLL